MAERSPITTNPMQPATSSTAISHQTQQPTPVQTSGVWSTTLFSCFKDEESCWWGAWCCCLLASRTGMAFGVESSFYQAVWFNCSVMLSFILVAIRLPALGILLIIASSIYYAYTRASGRQFIRNALNITGTITSDFISHCCCSCCTVCQEAREDKLQHSRKLDFCFGEDLVSIDEANSHVQLGEENGNFMAHMRVLSKTSRVILMICAALALASIVLLADSAHALNILILLLVFVQPFLILYFVYWRSRRKNASLDYVVKIFAVGFFMSTTQSVFFESILQTLIGILTAIVLAIQNPDLLNSPSNGENDPASNNASASLGQDINTPTYFAGDVISRIVMNSILGMSPFSPQIYQPISSGSASASALSYDYSSGNEVLHSGSGYFHPHFIVTNGTTTMSEADSSTDDDMMPLSQHNLRQNFALVVVILFLMAYVVAAGVEETMKHFAVRCCRFPAPLKDPHAVLVYMMTGALGFATAENIEYVFGAKASPIPGTSLIVGELFVLLIRVLMPIHVICSVLQATSLSKVLMRQSNLSLVQILLPAIALHGSFDFTLFLFGAMQVAFELGNYVTILSFFICGCLTIGGTAWAYTSFEQVVRDYGDGWQRFEEQDDSVLNGML